MSSPAGIAYQTNPCTNGNNPTPSASKAASDKTKRYADLTQHQQAKFIPFAVEIYGGLDKQANNFINALASYAVDYDSSWSSEELSTSLRAAVGCAIARGNALTILAGNMHSVYRSSAAA